MAWKRIFQQHCYNMAPLFCTLNDRWDLHLAAVPQDAAWLLEPTLARVPRVLACPLLQPTGGMQMKVHGVSDCCSMGLQTSPRRFGRSAMCPPHDCRS